PYSPKKNVFRKWHAGIYSYSEGAAMTSANNVNLIRYTDILLRAAELEIETGDLNIARNYVHQVRTRAANSSDWVKNANGTPVTNYKVGMYTKPWTDQAFARKAVRYERILELAMEGHRFFDLVRWGIADIEINAYLQKEKISRTYLDDAVFLKNENEY